MESGREMEFQNMTLNFLKKNDKATIIKIDTNDMHKLRKMAAFGIMPGADIIVLGKYPAFLLRIGFTEVALDKDIASCIIVERRKN